MDSAYIGTVRQGKIFRQKEDGYLLLVDDYEIMLPFSDTDFEITDDESVEVFIYSDKNGEVFATSTIPAAQKNNFGWANVVEVIPHLGVFVDIGLDQEILVSKDDLPAFESVWPQADDKLFVKLTIDEQNRLLAIPATEEIFFDRREIAVKDLMYQEVSGHVYRTGYEGSAVFTKDQYRGFIHRTMRKQEPRLGEYIEGRIIDVKEDGTINITLLPSKRIQIEENAELILNYLINQGGEMPFSSKSDPEHIRQTFNMSKSAFKRALGRLLKQQQVILEQDRTLLSRNQKNKK